MSRWLVTQGDHQFSAQDLSELQQLATQGRIGPGDMVQPPGASDWLYAAELPELKGVFSGKKKTEDDEDVVARPGLPRAPLIAILAVLALGGLYGMFHYYQQLPKPGDLALLGGGGMALTEMLVTSENAALRSAPAADAAESGKLVKDSRVQLVAKRGDFYHIRQDGGPEGWVNIKDVIPAYFFADERVKEDYDPIYNPDTYVFVKSSSWMQVPDEERQNVTVFQFLLQNKSKFEMKDIQLLAIIKDRNDRVLERQEIKVDGSISPYDTVSVGTLLPPMVGDEPGDGPRRLMTSRLFDEMVAGDATLNDRWSEGIEVQLESVGFESANIELLEVRAVPRQLD